MHSQRECQDYCAKDHDATVAWTIHSQRECQDYCAKDLDVNVA